MNMIINKGIYKCDFCQKNHRMGSQKSNHHLALTALKKSYAEID